MNSLARLVVAVIASLALLPSSAAAQKLEGQFAVEWIPTSDTPPLTAISISKGQSILTARMLPTRLLLTNADVLDRKGRLILPKDSELAFAKGPYFMACVIDARKIKRAQRRKFVANSFNTCLVDLDRDGKFDHRSEYASRYWSLGAVGKILDAGDVVPTSYREEDRELSKDYFTLRLVLLGGAKSAQNLVVGICFGDDPVLSDCLTERPYTSVASFPAHLEVMGARLAIRGRQNGRAEIVVEQPISRDPISIQAKWF